jgi:acyl dehydratase
MVREQSEIELAPIGLPDIMRYAEASGDFNPIHFDREIAQKEGYENNFAQGMLVAGILGGVVADHYGPHRVREFGVRFIAPCWSGVAPVVRIIAESRDCAEIRLDLEVLVDGEAIVKGWAVVIEFDVDHDAKDQHSTR